MLVEKYLTKQLEEISKEPIFHVPNIQALIQLAKINRLVIFSTKIICDGLPKVADIYPVEDQTVNSKQKILLISSSLAQVHKLEKYQALVSAVQSGGLVLREAEIDEANSRMVIGRIDRTWFILGEEQEIISQGFEVGFAVQTLARKLEQLGLDLLYLAQKSPKRFLGVISVRYSVPKKMAELVNLVSQMGIEVILLSSMKNAVLKGLAKEVGINLVQSELSLEEKKLVLGGLNNQDTMVVCDAGFNGEIQSIGNIIVLGDKDEGVVWAEDFLALVELIGRSKRIINIARKKYFWSKI